MTSPEFPKPSRHLHSTIPTSSMTKFLKSVPDDGVMTFHSQPITKKQPSQPPALTKFLKAESMEGRKVRSDCSFRTLPTDLLPSIFAYLPVKSLLRFTSVSKSCLHLIKCDPEFSRKHYLARKSSSTSSPTIVEYIATNAKQNFHSQVLLKFNLFSLTEKKTFHLESKLEVGSRTKVRASNFCHGITCVYLSGHQKMVLFNPAIREVVEVPVSRNTSVNGLISFGLGFDSKSNDYKIIALTKDVQNLDLVVDFYSVRNGYWYSLYDVEYVIGRVSMLGSRRPVLNAEGSSIVNFMAEYDIGEECREQGVLSFDMSNESFWTKHLPQCLCSPPQTHCLLPSTKWQACFCCCASATVGIWVLNGPNKEDLMWIKYVSVKVPDSYNPASPVEVWLNDRQVLLHLQKKVEGSSDEKCPAEMFGYDAVTKQLKRIREPDLLGRDGSFYIADVDTESLISIKRLSRQDGNNSKKRRKWDDSGSVCFIREIVGKK